MDISFSPWWGTTGRLRHLANLNYYKIVSYDIAEFFFWPGFCCFLLINLFLAFLFLPVVLMRYWICFYFGLCVITGLLSLLKQFYNFISLQQLLRCRLFFIFSAMDCHKFFSQWFFVLRHHYFIFSAILWTNGWNFCRITALLIQVCSFFRNVWLWQEIEILFPGRVILGFGLSTFTIVCH